MPLGTSLQYPFPYKTLDGGDGTVVFISAVFSGNVTITGTLSVSGTTSVNNLVTSQNSVTIVANTTVTTLSSSSAGNQFFKETGVGNYTGCTMLLPAATTLSLNQQYTINQNCTTTSVVVQTSLAAAIVTAAPGAYIVFIVIDNTINTAAAWDYHAKACTGTTWSSAALATASIINASNGLNGTVGAVTPNTGQFSSIGFVSAGSAKFTSIQTTAGNSTLQNLGVSAALYLQNATSGTGQVRIFPGTSGTTTWRYPVTDGATGDHLLSGAGSGPMTWYTPLPPLSVIYTASNASIGVNSGALYYVIEMVGGGGAAQGSGTGAPGAGSAGNNSTATFTGGGAGVLTCNGGGYNAGQIGAAGGAISTSTVGTLLGSADLRKGGGGTGAASVVSPTVGICGGTGGHTPFGWGGNGSTFNGAGNGGEANSGGGGGGAFTTLTGASVSTGGAGGGSYAKIYTSNLWTNINFVMGAAIAGGAAGTTGNTGGGGAAGCLKVTAYYQ